MNTESKEDVCNLLGMWRSGDQEALNRLTDVATSWMRAVARKALGTNPRTIRDSEDLVQEAWWRLLRSLKVTKLVPRDAAHFWALMRRIIKTAVIDVVRKSGGRRLERHFESVVDSRHPVSGVAEPYPGVPAAESAANHEELEWMRLARTLVSEEARELIVLREFEKLSWQEVGELKNLEADAARKRYVKVQRELASIVGQLRRGRVPEGEDAAELHVPGASEAQHPTPPGSGR